MIHKYTFLVLLLGSTLFLACHAAPRRCYLSPTGKDNSTLDCTLTDPCRTIKFCLQQTEGDSDVTVVLDAGLYLDDDCTVFVNGTYPNKQLTNLVIQGVSAASTVLDCNFRASHFRLYDIKANFTIRDVTLHSGYNPDDGGCLIASGVQGLVVSNVTFSNCSSNRGGAIYTDIAASISNSTFVSNSASRQGGALYLDAGLDFTGFTVSQSSIRDNRAYNGAGLYAIGDYVTLLDVNITNNTAFMLGGGVYLSTKLPEFVGSYNFTGSTIANNSAQSGGGLYSDNLNHTWNINGGLFVDNYAFYLDSNIACGLLTSVFCYSCVAADCATGCPPGANQSCSQNTTASTAYCYSNQDSITTCHTNQTCSCAPPPGLSTTGKVVIVLIAVCMFVGIVLIIVDVTRHFLRKRKQTGYSPIK